MQMQREKWCVMWRKQGYIENKWIGEWIQRQIQKQILLFVLWNFYCYIYNIISHFIHRTTGICTLLKIKSFPVSVEEILWNLAAY